MKTISIMLLAGILLTLSAESFGCTTFVLQDGDQIVYGRNLDFNIGNGFIINNQRGISKYAFVGSESNLMTWTSEFGSITFNQFGKEFPYGGMNEKGLVIAQMYLGKTQYPAKDDRKVISVLQWIQYQLDVSATVEEVIASDTLLRISNEVPVGIHFLVCDASGNTATIEFIEGKMVHHTDEALPIPLLTNNTYDESISYLQQFDIMGGEQSIPYENIYDIEWTQDNTLAVNKVFATAARSMNSERHEVSLVESAFDVLQSVTITDHTQWSTVFDVTNKMIYFKNAGRKEIMKLDFADFSFEAGQTSKLLDIQSASAEDIKDQFIEYSFEINKAYVLDAFIPLMESGFIPVQLPDQVIEAHARFPETLVIAE